jgi:hypothetical protein
MSTSTKKQSKKLEARFSLIMHLCGTPSASSVLSVIALSGKAKAPDKAVARMAVITQPFSDEQWSIWNAHG